MRREETGRYLRKGKDMSPSNDAAPNDSWGALAASCLGMSCGGGGGGNIVLPAAQRPRTPPRLENALPRPSQLP